MAGVRPDPVRCRCSTGLLLPLGDRGGCLGYGETVCSSPSKCVSADAACSYSYKCAYEGFLWKSNVTECVDEYDGLLTRFNMRSIVMSDTGAREQLTRHFFQRAQRAAREGRH